MHGRRGRWSSAPLHLAWLALACSPACGQAPTEPAADVTPARDTADLDDGDTPRAPLFPPRTGLHVRMDFRRSGQLFTAPVPALDLTLPSVDAHRSARHTIADWPGVAADAYLSLLLPALVERDGRAAAAGAVYLPLGGVDARPGTRARLEALGPLSLTDDAAMRAAGIFVWVEDPSGALRPWPVTAMFMASGGPFGADDLLAVKPIAGLPFPAGRTALVAMTDTFANAVGAAPGRDAGLSALLSSDTPPWDGWFRDEASMAAHDDAYRALIDKVSTHLAPAPDTAADADLDAFRAGLVGAAIIPIDDAPARFLGPARAALSRDLPTITFTPFTLIETYDDFCVAAATATLPDYQHGPLPFSDAGSGAWLIGDDGAPTLARMVESRVFVTVPRGVAPEAASAPLAVFVRTGGGGDRPLIDRGVRAVAHGEPVIPHGSGPAGALGRAGWIGLSWDGPHGGLRNVTGGDEQFLMFNMVNPTAAIANVQQTAVEAAMIRAAFIDTTSENPLPSCAGGPALIAEAENSVIVGHSMGAWVSPLAMALEPAYTGAVLSGAGGGWIENVLYKQSPLEVRPIAELILGYGDLDRALSEHDPALTVLQWAGEAADPQVFGGAAMTPARDVLVYQGIVDTYIMPPIAQALQVALGLDIAGTPLDVDEPRLASFPPLADTLALVGRGPLPLPINGNRDGRTAVVVQLAEDGIEDGHEVFFQRADARTLFECWLRRRASGQAPTIEAIDAPCGSN